MGEGDVQGIREDLSEVKECLGDLSRAVTDLRVLVAGNYITKDDFTEFQKVSENRVVALHKKVDDNKDEAIKNLDAYRKDQRELMFKVAGLALMVSSITFGILQWVVSLSK